MKIVKSKKILDPTIYQNPKGISVERKESLLHFLGENLPLYPLTYWTSGSHCRSVKMTGEIGNDSDLEIYKKIVSIFLQL